jgi:hypothetical protein
MRTAQTYTTRSGQRAQCDTCRWASKLTDRVADARRAAAEHNAEHHSA